MDVDQYYNAMVLQTVGGLICDAIRDETVQEVPADQVSFLPFHHDRISSIGSRNLRVGTIIMIVSKHGAIVAHIFPNRRPQSAQANGFHEENSNDQSNLDQVFELYEEKRAAYFPAETTKWVVVSFSRSDTDLDDQRRAVDDRLERANLTASSRYTTFTSAQDPRNPHFKGKNTVFVDGNGEEPVVYVEDKIMNQYRDPWSLEDMM
ncbi:MAG: hypothetical protein M1825_004815 [Sarcosagium campestre]|nr:MAG: hypothetical protein M1825_004815 [Sarcosagium campestre]